MELAVALIISSMCAATCVHLYLLARKEEQKAAMLTAMAAFFLVGLCVLAFAICGALFY